MFNKFEKRKYYWEALIENISILWTYAVLIHAGLKYNHEIIINKLTKPTTDGGILEILSGIGQKEIYYNENDK